MDDLRMRAQWVARSLTFTGEVQMEAFRRRLLQPIHAAGLAGWIGNDQHDQNLVHAVLAGSHQRLFTFIEDTGEYMNCAGVEMKVHTVPVSPEVLPLPAVRLPDSGHDVEDRFDKAIDLLTDLRDDTRGMRIEMREGFSRVETILERIEKNTDLLPAIKKNTDMLPAIKANTDAIRVNTDLLPAIKKNTDMLPAIKANTDLLPAIKENTDAIRVNTDLLPAIKENTDEIRVNMDLLPAIKKDTSEIRSDTSRIA